MRRYREFASVMLADAEHVQTLLFGEDREVDELAQSSLGAHGVALGRTRQLTEGEETNLHTVTA